MHKNTIAFLPTCEGSHFRRGAFTVAIISRRAVLVIQTSLRHFRCLCRKAHSTADEITYVLLNTCAYEYLCQTMDDDYPTHL